MQIDTTPKLKSYDVVIIGGAMMGASVAWFLANRPDFDGTVLVVERAPDYEFSSTAHSNSCIRQQFTQPINVQVSQFGADYVHNFRQYMGGDPDVPEIHMQPFGYMYLAATAEGEQVLRAAQQMQAAEGAGTQILTRDMLAEQFPFYNLDGIRIGSHNPVDEGYFDGGCMFDWWRRKARAGGVEFINNEVTGISRSGNQVSGVVLVDGTRIGAGHVVNAAGPRAGQVAQMAGLELPVEPRKRYTFVFEAARPLDVDLPLTVDPSGVHVRSEGKYYMAGCPPFEDPAVAPDDFIEDHSLWEEKVWPAIAERIPQFEALKLIQSWVGHYAYNTLDQNAIIGAHPEVSNFMMINGFSGHGLQQAPAMGRGLAEWIATGRYETLDLSPFAFDRIPAGQPLLEQAVI
ncbi:NAD(P)/FAD-dependent oxidoreductase [Parasedimentitalea huanghaiensis]|uniref:FAD-dependent oxidoreductase n=1 Tax=Parasedimentitalea huanghaiensis TaxID=2682100 RepID=A0A6L6WBE3_9RHOB|nr:FAD-binding oxidoreductase [Zongyanglinia huanghaiensis]MVO15004.1 FAD-dependent oxidoreductase [Zongyanglinia huanghaiensis]